MAGGTPEHGVLAMKLATLLGMQLPARCQLASSDVKVNIQATGLTTYPDLSVVCGALERSPHDHLAMTNPVILVEVTSPSTEDYDRGDKLSHYRQLASLQTVLIVSHSAKRVTVVQRDGPNWVTTDMRSGELVTLPTPALTFSVDALYSALDGLTG